MGKVEREMRSMPYFEKPVQEEMVRPQSKVCFERNRLMEAQKQEMVWNFGFEVCFRLEMSWKGVLEMEKEEALVSEDLEKVRSSFLSRDENSVSKRVASPI